MVNEDAEYWSSKGDEFYNVNNFEEAIKCYEKAAQLIPDDAIVIKNWADALVELVAIKQDETLYQEAFEKYDKATRLDPNDDFAFSSWANALAELAAIKQDEALYQEAFEKYEKAIEKDPNDDFSFSFLGKALAELAAIKQDETLYREAFGKYKEATEKAPNDDFAFKFWGDALAELGAINQDETLYREAFGKYKEATEKAPNNAYAFRFWGYALAELAAIKQDEALYQEAFEKYKRATDKNPDNANAFSFWGVALAELGAIKHDETLYREAFEKFDKTTRLESKDAIAFNNWGYAIAELAKLKKSESLYLEAIEKYKKTIHINSDYAITFNNWGYAITDFAEITKDKNLIKPLFDEFHRESDSLKKLNNDILGLWIIFNKKNVKKIIDDKEIFFSLLDLENYDSVFFKEITKGITDIEELKKYKRAYILSVLIISQLHINDENEKSVAYYTKKSVSQEMLFNDKAFRLNAINYSNDPTEGKILLDYLFGEGKYPENVFNTGYGAFAGCFTFNHDSLNQFRLYGKESDREGTGLSLVFKPTFFSKEAKMAMKQDNISVGDKQHALFRCIYIDPLTWRVETVGHKEAYLFYRENNDVNQSKDIEEEINNYRNYIAGIIESVKHEMKELQELVKGLEPEIIGRLLINLRYLTKHIAFKEEQECRIIKILSLKNNKEVNINPTPDENNIQIDKIKQLYIDYQNITGKVEKIYFGPNAEKIELFQDLLRYKGHNITCEKSKNPLSP